MIFLYLTNPTKKIAKKIAIDLLKKRLAACVNIFPVESFYWWGGKIVKDKEWVLIIKSTAKNFVLIQKTIERSHSYQIPCLVAFSGKANKKFKKWIKKETR